jgi:hypothetical protein
MLAAIVLPFLATIAGKVIGNLVAAPAKRPSGSDGAPQTGPTFAQTLAGQTSAAAPAHRVAARPGPPLPVDAARAALLSPGGRTPWVPGAFTRERGDPAGPVEAP